MISRFDEIRYNACEDFFEFDIDYDKFPKTASDYRKKWTICTNGERIETFRNPANNNEWSYRTIILAEKFKELFDNNSINYRDSDDLKAEILSQTKGKFFEDFFKLLRLTLQMRNSNPETGEDRILSPVKDKNGNFTTVQNMMKRASFRVMPMQTVRTTLPAKVCGLLNNSKI